MGLIDFILVNNCFCFTFYTNIIKNSLILIQAMPEIMFNFVR